MTHAWVDASAGVAGDMLLGALLDAGADLVEVQRSVEAMVADSVRIEVATVTRAGMRATKADVRLLAEDPPHRSWRTIAALLDRADLVDRVRDRAAAVFRRLAEAESRAHGIDAADVHFHEVGALDSIADVVGVCAALESLGVETLSAGDVAVGSGELRMAHGSLSVPGPAVVELARGWRISAGGVGELTTPTGMALLAALAESCEPLPPMTVGRYGTGAGSRDVPGRPNVTRVIIGEPPAEAPSAGSPAVVLEANVDDFDPRLWPDVLARLLAAGADDAWLVPIAMKKGRPAHTLAVLSDPVRSPALRELMFSLTSTIGVRQSRAEKHALARLWIDVDLAGGPVSVKVAHDGRTVVQVSAEFDSVARHAAATGQTQLHVLAQTTAAASALGVTPGTPIRDLLGLSDGGRGARR